MNATRDGRDRAADPLGGTRLALSLLTVAPLRVGSWPPSRGTARTAMLLAPLVGAVLGLAAGGVAVGARHAQPLLGGVLAVADLFPIRHFFSAFLTGYDPATTGAGFEWGHLAILAVWGVAGLLLAVRYFRWSPRGG